MDFIDLLDPTAERDPVGRPLAPRGDVFLDELELLLQAEGIDVARTAKPTFTKPAPADLRREIAESCDAVIEALAD